MSRYSILSNWLGYVVPVLKQGFNLPMFTLQPFCFPVLPGLPGMLVLVYAIVMVLKPEQAWCWKGYAGMNEIWILMGPLLLALVVISFNVFV